MFNPHLPDNQHTLSQEQQSALRREPERIKILRRNRKFMQKERWRIFQMMQEAKALQEKQDALKESNAIADEKIQKMRILENASEEETSQTSDNSTVQLTTSHSYIYTESAKRNPASVTLRYIHSLSSDAKKQDEAIDTFLSYLGDTVQPDTFCSQQEANTLHKKAKRYNKA